jgi:hypothetical protein
VPPYRVAASLAPHRCRRSGGERPTPTTSKDPLTCTRASTALLTAFAAVAIGCGSRGEDTTGPGDQDTGTSTGGTDAKRTVILEVTGPKTADTTYGLNVDQSQENGAKVPWKKTLTTEDLTVATVVAQNKGKGKISCKITVDGKVAKTNPSSGEYAVATCTADNF